MVYRKIDNSNLKKKSLDCAIKALNKAQSKEAARKVYLDFEVFKDNIEFQKAIKIKQVFFKINK